MHATAIFVFALPSTIPKSIFHFLFARLCSSVFFESIEWLRAGGYRFDSFDSGDREGETRVLSIVQKMSVER